MILVGSGVNRGDARGICVGAMRKPDTDKRGDVLDAEAAVTRARAEARAARAAYLLARASLARAAGGDAAAIAAGGSL